MSELNQGKVLECYDCLRLIVLRFIHEGFPDEAHTAVTHIMSMVIIAEAALFKDNVEQTMERYFEKIGFISNRLTSKGAEGD